MYRIFILIVLAVGCSNPEVKPEVNVKDVVSKGEAESTSKSIVGDWHGLLEIGVTKLRLSFHITETEGKLITTFDSLDQGAMGLATTSTSFDPKTGKLDLVIENIAVTYVGTLKEGKISGTFTQAGQTFPLELGRTAIAVEVKKRPQEPSKPYPYKSEEVTFENTEAKIILAGTLTLPKDVENPPVVILISGSGPQNRDEEVLGHRPFLIWSDYLTRRGIAVLRYDDRGVGKSGGVYAGATTIDFSTDAAAAFVYLKTRSDVLDIKKIGLMGHSEGGLIAPIVASKNKDVAFTILLAGTGVDGLEILRTQSRRSLELDKATDAMIDFNERYSKAYEIIHKQKDASKLKEELKSIFDRTKRYSRVAENPIR